MSRKPQVRSIANRQHLRLYDNTGVISCGIDERPAGTRWGDASGPTHLVFFAVRGSVEHLTVPPPTLRFARGERLVIAAGRPRWFLVCGATPATLLWFHFAPGRQWDVLVAEAGCARQSPNLAILHAALQALLLEHVAPEPSAHDACDHLSGLILHYLQRELMPSASSSERDAHRRLTELWDTLNGTLAHAWSVADMAVQVHMSEGHFNRTVRRLYGLSAMAMLVRLRMESAAMLLRTSSLGLEDVAREVGYGSAHAFSDAFQRHMGCRPGRFRSARVVE